MDSATATLYIVATPIGNLQDITLRALDIFASVDIIACEDTRHTLKLLNSHGISKKLMSCHANAEETAAERIIALLADGKSIAYSSDAGTPGFSDPGSVLVRKVRESGFPVVPIPGASAAIALVSVSGMRGRGFLFEGFLSPKRGRRRRRLGELNSLGEPFLVYESPFRIIKLMADLAEICPERPILIGREMTKIYEEFIEGTCKSVHDLLVERGTPRGEYSLLVGSKKKD